jgi:hypothetical protein
VIFTAWEMIRFLNEESVMKRWSQAVSFALALAASVVIVVPVALHAASGPEATAVTIPDFRSIAGRWSGIVYGRPGGERGRDWVELAIQNDGTYTLASARTIGVFNSSGTLRLTNGQLISEGEDGHVTYTLYRRDGKRFLRAQTTMKSGQRLRADLYPAR